MINCLLFQDERQFFPKKHFAGAFHYTSRNSEFMVFNLVQTEY